MVQVSYGCLVMVMAKGVSPIKSEPDSGPIWSAWNDGFALIGEHKPSSRITVEPGWTLRTQDSAGSRPASKLPIRYFQRAANDQLEVEVPGIRTFDIGYNVDQDVATLTVKLTNNNLDPTYSSWASANGDFGRPGWLTPDRGDTVNRWGYEPNEWHGLLTRNSLIRSFEGFGGQDMTIPEAVAAGHLVLTGVWLVDDAPVQTGQSLTLQCTNMAKLLVSQYVFGPLNGIDGLVPAGDYPMQRQRFFTTDVFSPGAIYGHLAVPPTFRILGIERTANGDGYWLVGTDGGIFSFGRSHFYGSTDSVGVTIPTGVYPNEGITSMARTATGEGYWLVTNSGLVFSFGDAIYHGGLSSPAPGPIVNIESAAPHDGYWMVDDRGEIYAFGGAAYLGGSPPLVSGAKVVDQVATPTGDGYWILDDQGHTYCQPVGTMVRVPVGTPERSASQSVNGKWAMHSRWHIRRGTTATTCDFCSGDESGPNVQAARTRLLQETREVPIETLGVGDRVVSYDIDSRVLHKSGSRISAINRFPYSGPVVTIETESGLRSTYTPEHKCVIGLDTFDPHEIVYLMRRGSQYRIGRCSWSLDSQNGAGGPVMRCRGEGGDAFWILSAHGSKEEAALAEALAGHEFGIPTIGFVTKYRMYRAEGEGRRAVRQHIMDVDRFWIKVGDNSTAAARCLTSHGRDIASPFWTLADGGFYRRRPYVTAACNLMSGMAMLRSDAARINQGRWTLAGKSHGGVAGPSDGAWSPIVVQREWYDGDIVSMSVEDNETYVADGLVTHNSYGDAVYHGGLAVPPSGGKVVGMAATSDGGGYWMTATDGGVFAFGNATFYGSIPGISPPVTLNDPVSDIVNAGTDKGYWLVAEDGGVFTFGAVPGGPPFYGSLVGPSDFVFSVDGNYFDLVDIIHDLAAYAGFHLYDGGATDNIYGVLESTGIYADDTNGVSLDAVFFDKLTVIDPLHKIREIVSYLLTVDDEGGLQFHEANIWASGNYFLDHTHTDTIPVIDERVQLTDYTRSIPDKDLRSSIIISTDDPEAGTEGTITTSFVPATASELRGMIRPAMWVNELFATPEIQQTMAQLIALQIYFRSRLGSVTCLGNPMISVDDQVQILERETSETNTHYVRAHRRTHDHKTGSYLSQLTTNVLSPPGDWVVVKPDGSPTGSIVSNRTI